MAVESKLPATIASRYLPVRVIGKGGMGVVYEVVDAHTGEHLALKLLQGTAGAPAEALERFKREARAPAQIKSENVVRVSDADVAPELDDAPFLVMELLEGMDLEQAASRSKPDPTIVVGWLRQIARALDKVHRLGIIHRDLKPENLFLATVEDRPPVVKILDFGIAKMAEEGSAATVSGQVLGTPKYMAPEQAARHPHVTPATDRYALGLIAYRLLVGESYHRGAVMSILAEVIHGEPSAPSARNPSLGEAFDAWFMQACHREPERRFASASQQVEALAEALGLSSGAGEWPGERGLGAPAGGEREVPLPARISQPLPGGRAYGRRTLAVGALILGGAATALFYRGASGHRPDAGAAVEAAVTPSGDPVAPSSLEVSATPDSRPAVRRTGDATAALAPDPGLGAASAASASARPRSITTSARSDSASGKPRRRALSAGPVHEPPRPPARDPFKDQK